MTSAYDEEVGCSQPYYEDLVGDEDHEHCVISRSIFRRMESERDFYMRERDAWRTTARIMFVTVMTTAVTLLILDLLQ